MNEKKITAEDVSKFLDQMPWTNVVRADGTPISKSDVVNYVRQLEKQVVTLACAVADRLDSGKL